MRSLLGSLSVGRNSQIITLHETKGRDNKCIADDIGCLTVKLPFPLTIRFKSMLQSGVATRDLDVQWVSSLSWYFLNLFGLQSVFIFILGDDNGKPLIPSGRHYLLQESRGLTLI